MKRLLTICLAIACVATSLAAQRSRYEITVKADEHTDFAKIRSYTWETGRPSFDKDVHQQVLDSVDRELKALGLQKRASGPADVTVIYETQRRTDVDVNAKPDSAGARPSYAVGVLLVLMRESGTRKELFRGRADKPLDVEPEKVKATIDEIVTEMFSKYPTRMPKK